MAANAPHPDDNGAPNDRDTAASPSGEQLREMNERLLVASIREQELAETADAQAVRMQALLESLNSGVVVLDAGGRIVIVNAVAQESFPFLEEDSVWSPDLREGVELREPDDAEIPFEDWPISRALAGELFVDVELIAAGTGGEERHFIFNSSVIRDDAGDLERALVVWRDVTELRELEKLRSEYTSMISHDLRSPLNAIAGYAGLLEVALQEQGLDREADHAGAILSGVEAMDAMIQDLGQATRLESGGLDMHPVSTDVADLVSDAIDQNIGIEQRHRLEVEEPETPLRAAVDRNHMARAIANLLTNALKYSPADSPVVIRLRRREDEAVLSVVDRGEGIADEELSRLFSRFYRAKNNESDGSEGLGLGLYITRLIAEQHGGRVCAESELGEGSRFHIALPAEAPDSESA